MEESVTVKGDKKERNSKYRRKIRRNERLREGKERPEKYLNKQSIEKNDKDWKLKEN